MSAIEHFDLPGFEVQRVLGHGAQSVVYAAKKGGVTYAVKVQRDASDESARRHLFREAAALARLTGQRGVIQLASTGQAHGRVFLVMEWVDGVTLAKRLDQSRLTQGEIIDLARSLAGALRAVHRFGLVHGDLKPANILLDERGQPNLIDFGLVTRIVPSVAQSVPLGTLQYSAPERLGVLKRPTDGRSDLYSLGALLWEAATGRRLFDTQSPEELMQLHATSARVVASAHRGLLAPPLGTCLARLLAKDPDDRHQTAQELLDELDALAATDAVDLGRPEPTCAEQVTVPGIVGRHAEQERFAAVWEALEREQGHFALLVGSAGIGKSHLAQRLVSSRAADAWTIEVKCPPEENLPFAPVKALLERILVLLLELRKTDPGSVEELLDRSTHQLPFLLRIMPQFRQLRRDIGLVDNHLDVQEQQASSIAHFIAEVATCLRPVVVLLDDLHWLDDASDRVLRQLQPLLKRAPLVIIGTARPEPSIEELSSYCDRVDVAPLSADELEAFVRAQLATRQLDPALVALLRHRSDGNPLFVRELLSALIDSGVLRFEWNRWRLVGSVVDLSLPEDVLHLIGRRVERLGADCLAVLRLAATAGHTFRSSTIEALVDGASDQLLAAAGEMVIEPAGPGTYRFVHDRLREALLADTPPGQAAVWHSELAEALERVEGDSADVYALAHHRYEGRAAVAPPLVFETVRRAAAAAADDQALMLAWSFVRRADSVAEENGLATDSEFDLLYTGIASRSGAYQEAIDRAGAALGRSNDGVINAWLAVYSCRALRATFQNEASFRRVAEGLRSIGHRVPRPGLLGLFKAVVIWLLGIVRFPREANPGERDPRERLRCWAAVELSVEHGLASYYTLRPLEMLQGLLLMRVSAMRLGAGRHAAEWRINAATVTSILRLKRLTHRLMERALAMGRALGDPVVQARLQIYQSIILDFLGQHDRSWDLARATLSKMDSSLDLLDRTVLVATTGVHMQARGRFRETLNCHLRFDRDLQELPDSVPTLEHAWLGAPAHAMLGRLSEAEKCLAAVQPAWIDSHWMQALFRMQSALTTLADPDASLADWQAHDERFEALQIDPRLISVQLAQYYFAAFLGRHRLLRTTEAAQHPALLAGMKKHLSALAKPGLVALMPHLELMRAAYADAVGRERAADRYLLRAERLANQRRNPWIVFEVALLSARRLERRGRHWEARAEAQRALNLANQFGWVALKREILAQFDVEDVVESATRSRSYLRSTSESADSRTVRDLRLQRYLDALLRVGVASAGSFEASGQARLVLDELNRIMGAERAFYFKLSPGAADQRLTLACARGADGGDLSDSVGVSATVLAQIQRERSPIIMAGRDDATRLMAESVAVHDVRSIMAAPMIYRDQLVGLIYLDSRLAAGMFASDDLLVLEALANQIAVSMETAKAARLAADLRTEKARRELAERTHRATTALSGTLLPQDTGRALLGALAELAAYDRGFVLAFDSEGDRVLARVGDPAHEAISAATDLYRAVKRAQGVFASPDRQLGPGWVVIPLHASSRQVGVCLLHRDDEPWHDHEADLFSGIAAQGALAVENARLFAVTQDRANTDALTGLNNRRRFLELADQEVRRAARFERSYCIAMIDIDHFKSFNDAHGHAVGDEVLQSVAARMQEGFREFDIVGRYGGEEFIVMLNEIDRDAAIRATERVRAQIETQVVMTAAGPLSVTASIGLAQGLSTDKLSDVTESADQALYQAKQHGRNRVQIAA